MNQFINLNRISIKFFLLKKNLHSSVDLHYSDIPQSRVNYHLPCYLSWTVGTKKKKEKKKISNENVSGRFSL